MDMILKRVKVWSNAIFLGGMSFNNAGLGYVHSMAHQLGAVYNLPHGVCCAMLLPVIEVKMLNVVPEAFRKCSLKALGLHVEGQNPDEELCRLCDC